MRVFTNTALSIDGKIGSARYDHVAIGSPVDRQYMSVLRARADAVLVGGRTFRNWPLPLVPDANAIATLRAAGFPDTHHAPLEGRTWWNVVLSRTLDVPKTGRFYQDPRVKPLFFSPVAGQVPGELEVGEVDVHRVIERLEARGVQSLLVEAGGDLIAQFLAAGVVDEIFVTVCPLVLGGRDAPTIVDGPGFPFDAAPRLTLQHAHRVGDELYCRYRVKR
ncbi:MAG: RibD family protein [Myxococcota bacterium]